MFSKMKNKFKEVIKEPCVVCGNVPSTFPVSGDGRICGKCLIEFKDMPNLSNRPTKEELLNYRKEQEDNQELNRLFNVTKRSGTYIEFDQEKSLFRLVNKGIAKKRLKYIAVMT